MPLTADKLFRVNISKDNLSATLSLHAEAVPQGVTADDIYNQLNQLGLKVNEQSRENIATFVESLSNGNIPQPVIVVQGKAPLHDQPGRIEKLYEENKQEEVAKDSQSYYDRSCIVTVKKDQEILRIIAPVEGKNGVDVYGKEVPRKLAQEAKIEPGINVEQKGDTIIATSNGVLRWDGRKVSVEPSLEVNGNVDFSVGNIDFDGDVHITKNVLDLFKVYSGRNIVVDGTAEAADIQAKGDLEIKGGMAGKDKGKFSAGRDLKGKYISNAFARANRHIEVRSEIVQSDVVCGGHVWVNGLLVGGKVAARGGVKVKTLGSEANVKTLVEAGIDEQLREKCSVVGPEIKKRYAKAQKVRQTVEPLMQYQKNLSPEQKEKATELLYQASELEDSAQEMIDELYELYKKAQQEAVAEVEVSSLLYPGVTIRFARVEANVLDILRGPVKIIPKRVKGSLRVLAINKNSGTSTDLGGLPAEPEMWELLDRLLKDKIDAEKPA